MHWMHLNLILMFCRFFSTHILTISYFFYYSNILWLTSTYAGGYYPNEKKEEEKPLIIKSDRNSHESRELFEYKLGMALDWKMYSVFVFICLEMLDVTWKVDIMAAMVRALSGLWDCFLFCLLLFQSRFFFRHFFNFLLMLFCMIIAYFYA